MRAFVDQRGSWIRVLFAWLLPLAAFIVQWVFWDQLGHYPWLFMYPATFFAARSGGLVGGLGATVLSSLLVWWFFLPPAFGFAGNELTNLLTVAVFFVASTAFSIFDQALRKSQQQYRALFDHAGDGIVRVSQQGRFLDVNDRFAAMLGLTRQKIIGALVIDLVADMMPPQWDELNRQLQAGNSSLVREHQLRRADGTLLPVEVTTTVLPGGDHLVIVHDISERKRAELALSESEAKFAKIFHSSPIALSISYMSNGEIIDINASHTRVYGYTRADVVGRTSLQLGIFTPEERAAAVAILQEHGEMHNFPFVVHCKSGELKESLSSSAVIDLPQGRCLLSSTIDISALKRLDAAVRASEERLRWALDASNEGLWDWDLATGAVAGNDQWFRLFGYEPGETPSLINLWSSTLHPNDAPATLRLLDDYLQDRRPDYRSEHRVVMKSGEVCWHQSVGKIVARDAAGRPVRMVGTNTDITLRKAAEMQLRDSEERFRLIVQNSPVPILIWDENAAIRYASPAFASVFGDAAQSMLAVAQALHACTAHLTDGDLSLAHLAASVSTQEAERWLPVLRAIRHCAQHPGDRVEIDINSPRSNGEWCDLHVIFQGFRNSAADVEIVSVIHDISEHRALQRLLEETNAELEQQVAVRTAELQASVTELRRANAGKDAFLAAISHELRTPLMGVLSMSELLASEERGPLNGHQAKYVDAITVSGERLLSTVNSVLLYTDLLAGNVPLTRELCHLDGLCAAAVRALQPDAERKQQHITQEIIPADLEIESDVQGLINVIKALLANAIKFTPAAGRIHLSARAMAGDEAGAIQIAVTDTGIGMSEAQISKLFRPFVQGDQTLARRFEGLGLGLAYVQKMVELLGGTTAVESELGKGSRITVTLPAK